MVSQSESETLTRVGPGTKMGALMRQYWIPAAKSSELVADGAPVRLVLLGEKLLAFRDSSGRVGIMDHRCPHRGASLFLGRNEQGGLRCVYHGWKYDVTGACLDMPNVPPQQDFKDKVRARAYPARDRNGVVWVYMGSRAEPPPMPEIEATMLPEATVTVSFVQRECNWLQAIEGEIDTSHFGFLHAGHLDPTRMSPGDDNYYTVVSRTPEYHCAATDWGTMYGAYRPADATNTYWRFAHFVFPFWAQIPAGNFPENILARAWVPMDDTHTMFVMFSVRSREQHQYLPNTTDWYGRWRLTQNTRNDYKIDRAAQAENRIFTGISGIHVQDQAVTESMGPIIDHGFENLAPSDLMISQTRRRILGVVEAFAKDGTVPPGVDDPLICRGARSGEFITPREMGWREAYREQLAKATRVESYLAPARARVAETADGD